MIRVTLGEVNPSGCRFCPRRNYEIGIRSDNDGNLSSAEQSPAIAATKDPARRPEHYASLKWRSGRVASRRPLHITGSLGDRPLIGYPEMWLVCHRRSLFGISKIVSTEERGSEFAKLG